MHGQGARGQHRADGHRRAEKERAQLLRLGISLLLFLTVFIGKGVFPDRMEYVSEQFSRMIRQNTDFRAVFSQIGETMSEKGSAWEELGNFCIEVFGEQKKDSVSEVFAAKNIELSALEERRFLNSGAGTTQAAAHYLRLEYLPEEWFSLETEEEEGAEEADLPNAVPAVGTVLLQAAPTQRALPAGHTMDHLSLGDLQTVTPVMGRLWSEYGYREHPIDGQYKFHSGVDLGAESGTDILAFAAGTVEFIGCSDAYGNYLQLDHGQGIKSFYAHCSTLCVEKGQRVDLGECIAKVGSTGSATGPHLHFELRCAGQVIDPGYYINYEKP